MGSRESQVQAARGTLKRFLFERIQSYREPWGWTGAMDPSTPNTWADGPDYDFPWPLVDDPPRTYSYMYDRDPFQILDIQGGYNVAVERTMARLAVEGTRDLDRYEWSIFLRDFAGQPSDLLAHAVLLSHDSSFLFDQWSNGRKPQLWVLKLLHMSSEISGETVTAKHLEEEDKVIRYSDTRGRKVGEWNF